MSWYALWCWWSYSILAFTMSQRPTKFSASWHADAYAQCFHEWCRKRWNNFHVVLQLKSLDGINCYPSLQLIVKTGLILSQTKMLNIRETCSSPLLSSPRRGIIWGRHTRWTACCKGVSLHSISSSPNTTEYFSHIWLEEEKLWPDKNRRGLVEWEKLIG